MTISNGAGYLLSTILSVSLLGLVSEAGKEQAARWDEKIIHEALYERTIVVADTNKDGRTSIEEWGQVYKNIGLRLDELNPRQLTTAELWRFVLQTPQ